MKKFKKITSILIAFLIWFLPCSAFSKVAPTEDNLSQYYNYRINYDLFANKHELAEVLIKDIADKVKKEKQNNYIVLLGNSVLYGSLVQGNKSIGAYLQQVYSKTNTKIYNLAIPSESFADIYVLLKLMDKYGLKRNNVIINSIYYDYMSYTRTPFLWFGNYLKYLDSDTYNDCLQKGFPLNTKEVQKTSLLTDDEILKIRNDIPAQLKKLAVKPRVYPEKAWSKNPNLTKNLLSKAYIWSFNDKPINLKNTNPSVYFLNKVLDYQKGKHTLFLYGAYNQYMNFEPLKKKGYITNTSNIDKLLTESAHKYSGLTYYNYSGDMTSDDYGDHIHLTPQGYSSLAEIIADRFGKTKN